MSGPNGQGTVGTSGLVANQSGWSYADDAAGPNEESIDHKSLVALTRGPRMVVEYFVAGGTPPYVRGVFIADEVVDNMLRLTEPKAHDSWQTKSEEGEVDAGAAAMASHVIARIRQTVANHRNRLKPPPPPPDSLNLPVFNEIMRRVMSGAGGGVRLPVPETRPISIHLDYHPVAAGDQIKIVGSASFSPGHHPSGVSTGSVPDGIARRTVGLVVPDRQGCVAFRRSPDQSIPAPGDKALSGGGR